MRNPLRRDRSAGPPAGVLARVRPAPGDRVLAAAEAEDGTWVVATRAALAVVGEDVRVLPWQEVHSADWNREEERLRVREVGGFGRPRPVHVVRLAHPGRLLEVVRERVTASVVLQRRVVVRGRQGLYVVARRSPAGGAITWAYELDAGLDPDDPEVRRLAELGVRAAAEELGLA